MSLNDLANITSIANCSDPSSIAFLLALEQCQFVKLCDLVLGHVNLLPLYYCQNKPFAIFELILCLAVCFIGVGLTASDYLTPNLHFISKFLSLLDNLAGLTLVALGNSSPDIVGIYKALDVGHGDLAVSELIGACFFITSVVVGSVSILQPFRLPKSLFLRDSCFFLFVSATILSSLLSGKINVWVCITLIVGYFVYVTYVVVSHSVARRRYLGARTELRIRNAYALETGIEEDNEFHDPYDVSNLPTIEDLNFFNLDDQLLHDELSSEIDQVRMELDGSDSYDLRRLIRELILKRDLNTIKLNHERPLSSGITMSDNADNDFIPTSDFETRPSGFISSASMYKCQRVDLKQSWPSSLSL